MVEPRIAVTTVFIGFVLLFSQADALAQLPGAAVKSLVDEGFNAINSGNLNLARKKLEEAIKIDPTNKRARKNLAVVYNNLAVKTGNSGDAKETLKLLHLAVYYDRTNEKIQGFYNRALRKMGKNPDSFSDRVKLGDEAKASGDLIGASIEYNAALKIKESRFVLKKLGEVAREQMQFPIPKTADTPHRASSKQKFVIDKSRVLQSIPRIAASQAQVAQFEAEMKQLIAESNQTFQEATADGYTAGSIQSFKDDTQNYIDEIVKSVRKKSVAEERTLASLLEKIAALEATKRGVARSQVKWRGEYRGKDSVDITDSVISQIQGARR